MKRILIAAMSALLLLGAVAYAYSVPSDTIVYVTPTGSKYHREDCTYIKDSYRTLTIDAAERQGYTPCSRCDPDVLTGAYVSDWNGESGTRGGNLTKEYNIQERLDKMKNADSQNDVAKMKSNNAHTYLWVIIILAGIPCISLLSGIVVSIADYLKVRKLKPEYTELYANRTTTEIARMCGLPSAYRIGQDGLPRNAASGFDNPYMVYVSKTGEVYHRTPHCARGANMPRNVVNMRGKRPCMRCHPILPNLEWYPKYKQIIATLDRLKIPYQK